MDLNTPVEVDAELARQYHELARVDSKLRSRTSTAQHEFGDRPRRFDPFTTTAQQAWDRVAAAAANGDKYMISSGRYPSELLADYRQVQAERDGVLAAIDELDTLYTGWSRFFLVTSSAGHIHSSMRCHSCYPTTTYGWRPDLSGKSEAEAVALLGPALCSVCFPSAPVEHQAKKVTKARALALAA
jgi:hypothetical protein